MLIQLMLIVSLCLICEFFDNKDRVVLFILELSLCKMYWKGQS